MSHKITPPAELVKMFTDILEPYDIGIRSYSGRAMYGKQCTAVVGSIEEIRKCISEFIITAYQEVITDALDAGDEAADRLPIWAQMHRVEDFVTMLTSGDRTDNMGRDYVMYWPSWEWVDPTVDESPEVCDDGVVTTHNEEQSK